MENERAYGLCVAGIGASAGGLEAMLLLFAHMRRTGRIAFVVAQHMAQNSHSELVVRLIGRESRLPVVLAGELTRLQADTVYVIPSGKNGRVTGGTLRLLAPTGEHISTPSVNALLTSIAEACSGHAIGIVLSGTGTDGVAGCRALKAAGGLTIVQDPGECKFDGMPQAVIDARVADRVLHAEAIGPSLAAMFPGTVAEASSGATSTPVPVVDAGENLSAAEGEELAQLLRMVGRATGIDFSGYKRDTLVRQLRKRKAVLDIKTAEAYQARVRSQPEELQVLQRLFLVSVSSFFRDRASFDVVERALAGAIADKPATEAVRVWVPGCASGEEAYTFAVVLAELLGEDRAQHPIEIIGTDLSAEALATARAGVYRLTAFREMEPGLRESYFIARGQHFGIRPEIGACVRFEQRDVLAGPPAGEFDLVSCRNLLIYLNSALQDQLMRSFHRALRAKGLMFLGASESLGLVGSTLFAPLDHFHRVFRRR